MPRLPKPRKGTRLQVLQRTLAFSYWPMYRDTRRFGLQSTVFVLDPWTNIRASVRRRCQPAALDAALALLEQAEDFYRAATTAGIIAARPLLLYYCFMNLAKAFILTVGQQMTIDRVAHGISERLKPANRELADAFLKAFRSPDARTGNLNAFDEFLTAVAGNGLPAEKDFDLPTLLPQVISGHRLWAEAAGVSERFIALHDIRFMQDTQAKRIWLSLDLFADDLTRLSITHGRLLAESRLDGAFREVASSRKLNGPGSFALNRFRLVRTPIAHQTRFRSLSLISSPFFGQP